MGNTVLRRVHTHYRSSGQLLSRQGVTFEIFADLYSFVHRNRFGVGIHRPDSGRADAGADPATDALVRVHHVFEPAVVRPEIARNRVFRAGLDAHVAIAASAAADAAQIILFSLRNLTALAAFKILRR